MRCERPLFHVVQRRLLGWALRYDQATASDLRYYALPDAQNRLESLLAKQAEEEKTGLGGADTVTPEQIAEIVAR